MTPPVLTIDGVTKYFGGVAALHDVSFHVGQGEILSLIGPNGAGKTTLFHCATGLLRPTAGRLSFHNGGSYELPGLAPERIAALGIARTFQNVRLFGDLPVIDNVRVARHCRTHAGLWGAVLRTRRERAEERSILAAAYAALDFVGLGPHWAVLAATLSYGDQRRLEIARALATEPRLLLVDEPAAGMNPTETAALTRLVRRIRESGITVLLIEHDMRVVMDISDRIVVLHHGAKIAEGSPAEVRADPAVVEAYLGHRHHAAP